MEVCACIYMCVYGGGKGGSGTGVLGHLQFPSMYNFRAKRCMDTPANSICSSPVTHLLSMPCVLVKILSHTSAKKKTKRLQGFKFHTFTGHFIVTRQ